MAEAISIQPPARDGLPRPARDFLALTGALAAAATLASLELGPAESAGWREFVALAAAASATQLCAFRTRRNQVLHATAVFFVAGAVLLPPALLALLPLVSHIPDWVRRRYAWYIQTFNILNFTLAVTAASIAARLVAAHAESGSAFDRAVPGLAAVLVYVVLNNAGFAIVLSLARGHRPTSILTGQVLVTDVALASMGVAVAAFWLDSPWLMPFAIVPLVLLHKSLHLPELLEEAEDARRFRALAAVTEPTGDSADAALAAALLPSVVHGLSADGGVLLVCDGDEGALEPAAEVGLGPAVHGVVRAGEAVARRAVEGRRADVLSGRHEQLSAHGIRSLAAVPLVEDGRLFGVVELVSRRGATFSPDRLRFLEVLAGRVARQLVLARTRRELDTAYAVRDGALESSRTGVCVCSPDGVVRFWNSAFARLLDVDAATRAERSLPAAVAAGTPWPGPGEEARVWTKDGRFLRVTSSRIGGGDLLVSVDDLTDQEREKETRARFTAEIVGAQDREARRIAELLHDDAVQRLTALVLRLELEARGDGRASLAELVEEASQITAGLRRLLVELHPAVLESRGLAAAIEAAGSTLRARGVDVAVTPLERRLPPEIEQIAYRLVQEALSNVLKHAAARRAEVSLSASGDVLRCHVSDDGRGLEADLVESAVSRGHLGLQLVRDRVEIAGGRFLLESRPGGGTVFAFELPLGPAAVHDASGTLRSLTG